MIVINSCEIVGFISALAIVIADQVEDEDLDLLAAALTQLGDTLATISTQRARQERCSAAPENPSS